MSFSNFKQAEFGKYPVDWSIGKLGEFITTLTDYHANGSYKKLKENVELLDEENYSIMIRTTNFEKNAFDKKDFKYITEEAYDFLEKTKVYKNDILMNKIANAGSVYTVPHLNKPVSLAMNLFLIRMNQVVIKQKYAYYFMKNYERYIKTRAQGSVTKTITKDNVRKLEIAYPRIEEQEEIVKVISSIEDKVEVNNQINKKLEAMAQSIFKHWFVDFEFPNENGEPYKSSGGEMIESELGMIPRGWEVKELGEIIELYDSKRIPLSKKEREKREKIYPYYGAASLMDYVDDYIFEGVHILMGEDGTVIDDYGFPILQYVWGKFWVNNHAHVIKGKAEISEEFIYILLKNTNVKSIVTGAVQLKINQRNLKSLKLVIPNDDELISFYSSIVNKSFNKIRNNCDEIDRLISIRDTLLPKLMSGEIRVPVDTN